MSTGYDMTSSAFYVGWRVCISNMVPANVRIAKEDYNIRLVTGPDSGNIGGVAKNFFFYYTKTYKKYEIPQNSHFAIKKIIEI